MTYGVESVTWWWTPTCGYLHVRTNPLTLTWHCTEQPDEGDTIPDEPNDPVEAPDPEGEPE